MSGTPAQFTLLTAARLLDGSGKPPLESAALLIEGERIAGFGRQGDVRPPDGVQLERVDYGDATILPGLVDAHTHLIAPGDGTAGDDIAKDDDGILLLRAAKNLRTILHSGVTTVRDNGAKNRVAFALREGLQRGLAVGPRVVICGRPITMTGGHTRWSIHAVWRDHALLMRLQRGEPVVFMNEGDARGLADPARAGPLTWYDDFARGAAAWEYSRRRCAAGARRAIPHSRW